MRLLNHCRWILCGLLLLLSANVMAQTQADKLYNEGLSLQKTRTIGSQQSAIKKFSAAKAIYTAPDNKAKCDRQIGVCNETIKKIKKAASKPKTTPSQNPTVSEDSAATQPVQPVQPQKRTDVRLSVSPNRLDYKYKPKAGATQSVEVRCNYDDWKIDSHPEWVTVYTAKDKFSVEVSENKTGEPRSGIIAVKCEDTIVQLVVNQDKKKGLSKLKDALKL